MFGNTVSDTDVRHAMLALRELGVATVTIEFSGGNDEGGADGAQYLDAEGNEATVPSSNAYNESGSRYDPASGKFVQQPARWVVYERGGDKRDATDEEVKIAKISQALEFPIYDRWGSFAGEFYVQGTLTWDVAKGTHRLSGQESVEHYEGFEYEG